MQKINNKTELSEFFQDTLLPYYELHYIEDLTRDDAIRLNFEGGLCLCAKNVFNVYIYGIMVEVNGNRGYILKETMYYGFSAKESLLPRIEWMKKFINDNLPCS